MKILKYRGFVIFERYDGLYIYKDATFVKRIETSWKSGLTRAKIEIDKLIKLHGV